MATATRRFSDICKGCGEEVDFFSPATGNQVKTFWHEVCREAARIEPTCGVCGAVSSHDPCGPCHQSRGGYSEDTTSLQAGYTAAAKARDANPRAFYGSGPGMIGGCSCTPNNGPGCVSCWEGEGPRSG